MSEYAAKSTLPFQWISVTLFITLIYYQLNTIIRLLVVATVDFIRTHQEIPEGWVYWKAGLREPFRQAHAVASLFCADETGGA